MFDPVTARYAIQMLKKYVPDLADVLEHLNGDGPALQMHITLTQAEIRELQRLIQTQGNELSTLGTTVSGHTGEISDLQSDVLDLQNAEPERPRPTEIALMLLTSAMDAEIRDLRKQVTTLSAQVSALAT